jgi:hypothetical protein
MRNDKTEEKTVFFLTLGVRKGGDRNCIERATEIQRRCVCRRRGLGAQTICYELRAISTVICLRREDKEGAGAEEATEAQKKRSRYDRDDSSRQLHTT